MSVNVKVKLTGSKIANWTCFSKGDTVCWVYDIWETDLTEFIKNLLNKQLSDNQLIETITLKVKGINRPFALIVITESQVASFVDHIQSYPLFYRNNGEEWLISDDPAQIIGEDSKLSKINVAGFMLTRYTLGNRTFFNDIFQIPAGQYLIIKEELSVLKDHYIYINKYPNTFDTKNKRFEFKSILLEILKEFLQQFGDKQLVLFLSGGFDSRLILFLLDELNIPKSKLLLCSYGRVWQRDVKWAKAFASNFPYKWVYVKKDYRRMRSFFQSNDRKKYFDESHKFNRKPSIMDMIGIKCLVEQGLINKDAIFITGMSGDFISGGHLQEGLKNSVSVEECVNIICKKHCTMWSWNSTNEQIKIKVKNQIKQDLESSVIDKDLSDSLYEWWEWRERQSKIMVATADEFNWYGYKLFLPLWDKRVMDFFKQVPFHYRISQKFYREFCNNLKNSKEISFVDAHLTKPEKAPLFKKTIRLSEFIAHPNWGAHTLKQKKEALKVVNNILGTIKPAKLPQVRGISNGLVIGELLKNYKLEE